MTPSLVPPPAALAALAGPAAPRGVVLFLHGGADRGLTPVDGRSLSRWRTARMLERIAPRLHHQGLATTLLVYRVKGWNEGREAEPMPVRDARWALADLHRHHPDLPVVLLGHSMGGRTAVRVASYPTVRGVVALAPWLPPGEPVDGLGGRPVLAAHGRVDRITSPRATRAFLERASAAGSHVEFADPGRVGHYMLRAERRWDEMAATGCLRLAGGVRQER